jgi:hypothetical protein
MQTENSSKQAENTESISMTQLLIHVFLDYLYELFIITPYLILKRFIHHPLFMSLVLVVVFPLLLFIRIVVGIWNFISSSTPTTNKKPLNRERNESRMFHTFDDSEEDELNQWQERCSICFESKLDLCLGYCRDQFCIDCFQQ